MVGLNLIIGLCEIKDLINIDFKFDNDFDVKLKVF